MVHNTGTIPWASGRVMLAAVVVVAAPFFLFFFFFFLFPPREAGRLPVAFLFLEPAATRSAHPWRVDHRASSFDRQFRCISKRLRCSLLHGQPCRFRTTTSRAIASKQRGIGVEVGEVRLMASTRRGGGNGRVSVLVN